MIRSHKDIIRDAETLKQRLKLGYKDSIDEYINIFSYMTFEDVTKHLTEAYKQTKTKVNNISEVICELGTYAIKTGNRKLLHNIYGCTSEPEWEELRKNEIARFHEVNRDA